MSLLLDKILKDTEQLSPTELKDLQIELIKRTQIQHRRTLYYELKRYLSFDVLYHLPVLLSLKILSYLDAPSLCAVSKCSQKCRELANDNNLWHKLCIYKGYCKFEYLPYPKWDNTRPSSPRHKVHELYDTNVHWKAVYMKVTVLHNNWRHGLYSNQLLTVGCKEPATAIIATNDILVSGCRDGTCTVWNLNTLLQIGTLRGHSDEINTVINYKDNIIITGCSDGLIRAFTNKGQLLWTLNTDKGASIELIQHCNSLLVAVSSDLSLYVWALGSSHPIAKAILHGHTKSITCMALTSEGILYTGSWDGTIRIWNCLESSNVHILMAHLEGVLCLLSTSDGQLVSGGSDSLIKLWEPVTGQLLAVMKGHQQEVLCLATYEDMIVSSSADSTVRIWTYDGTCIHVLHEHIGLVRCLKVKGNFLISAGDRKRINVWNLRNGQLLHTVHRQQNLIRYLEVTDRLIISASPSEGIIGVINYW